MTFEREGPPLEALVRRLAETPGDFLREPLLDGPSGVHVAAVAGDLATLLGGRPDDAALDFGPRSNGETGTVCGRVIRCRATAHRDHFSPAPCLVSHPERSKRKLSTVDCRLSTPGEAGTDPAGRRSP